MELQKLPHGILKTRSAAGWSAPGYVLPSSHAASRSSELGNRLAELFLDWLCFQALREGS